MLTPTACLIYPLLMITTERLAQMSDCGLIWTRDDLREVIALQEATVRQDGTGACPKLGEYHDDLAAVLTELRRRERSMEHRCECGRLQPRVPA